MLRTDALTWVYRTAIVLKRMDVAISPSINTMPASFARALGALPRTHFASGAELVKPGQLARLWFIDRGLVRLFSLNDAGVERNHDFVGAGSWVTGTLQWRDGALCCAGAALGVQALQSTIAVGLPISWLEQQQRESPEATAWLAQQLMQLSAHRLQREMALMQQSAEQRYRTLQIEQPDLLNSLRQHHIASWLGITAVALSRIKRRIASDRSATSAGSPSGQSESI